MAPDTGLVALKATPVRFIPRSGQVWSSVLPDQEVSNMEEICRKVMNPGARKKRLCGEPAVRLVTVNTVTGQAQVPMCTEHVAEHDRSAAKKRVGTK